MAICPKKVKKIYYIMFCITKKSNFVSYFFSKKNIEQKTFVPITLGTQNMHNFRHMSIFPEAHGT